MTVADILTDWGLAPTGEDSAHRRVLRQAILESYSPPLSEDEKLSLWRMVQDPVFINTYVPFAQARAHYSQLPPRLALKEAILSQAARSASREYELRVANESLERLNNLGTAMQRAGKSLGFVMHDFLVAPNLGKHCVEFSFADRLQELFPIRLNIMAIPSTATAGALSSWIDDDRSEWDRGSCLSELCTPGAVLRLQVGMAILGLIITHPTLAPLVKPLEHPVVPWTDSLCQEVVCAPPGQIPTYIRQWAILHLPDDAGSRPEAV